MALSLLQMPGELVAKYGPRGHFTTMSQIYHKLYQDRYLQLKAELMPYEKLWSKEVISSAPHCLEDYPAKWVQELVACTEHQLWQLDGHRPHGLKSSEGMGSLIDRLKSLTTFEKAPLGELIPPGPRDFWKVKGKKKHELETLIKFFTGPLAKGLETESSPIIDVCSGQGHLSRSLTNILGLKAIGLDADPYLHELARKKIAKYPQKESSTPARFITASLSDSFEKNMLIKDRGENLFQKHRSLIGLHTCGPLANALIDIKAHSRAKGLLSFGCCYLKLDPAKHTNISNFAKNNPTPLNSLALTLATRSHSLVSLEDFRFKMRVKSYRFALHLWLYEKHGVEVFVSVGNGSKELYQGPFDRYANNMMLQSKLIEAADDSKELMKFFKKHTDSGLLHEMTCANIIRWQLGRAVEAMITLDRALYLIEHGHDARIFEFFDEELSPRNWGIFAL